MNINRHNYEEFFLLYVDNELSAQERNAVEVFVSENADLKAELNLLQQTVFNTDEIVFENKQNLLKDEQASLKEQLMLYLDNELSAADNLNTAALLKGDKVAQKEFALLQRTQLQPGNDIIFADKKSLYRKEEGRVIGFAWWRVAAAAILLGFGVWGTIKVISNNKIDKGTEVAAGTVPAKQSGVPAVTNNNKAAEQKNTIANAVKAVENTKKLNGVIPADKSTTATGIRSNNEKDNNIAIVKEQPIKKQNNNLPTPDYNNFNNNDRNNTTIASVTPTDKTTDKFNSGNNDAVVPSTKTNNADNGYALTTNFTQSNSEEPNNDKVLYMDENNVKKSKLGGLFRKVKRLVERNTNIKTGDGIKVAGFDIAIK